MRHTLIQIISNKRLVTTRWHFVEALSIAVVLQLDMMHRAFLSALTVVIYNIATSSVSQVLTNNDTPLTNKVPNLIIGQWRSKWSPDRAAGVREGVQGQGGRRAARGGFGDRRG